MMTEEFSDEDPRTRSTLERADDSARPSELWPESVADSLPRRETRFSPLANEPALPMPTDFSVSALTDIGCVRTNNEDCFGYDESLGIFVVCDGMGGMASGEIASSRAVAAILEAYASSAAAGLPVSTRLLHAINTANTDVWGFGQIPQHRGMGTTAIVAAIDHGRLILGNVGDSRAYMMQDSQCVQLTVDHSYLNELIRSGAIALENLHQIDLQGMESVITRAIGVDTSVQPDFFSIDFHPGTLVLLATDGLSRYLLQDEIAAILSASPFENVCANLIACAKLRGGQDNITCLLLRSAASVHDDPTTTTPET